jgi:hypothetical protein
MLSCCIHPLYSAYQFCQPLSVSLIQTSAWFYLKITEGENQQTEAPSGDAIPGIEGTKTGPQNAETPLERICALPEHVADRELTANQERARFIAKDVRDYAEKAPAGLVVDSRAIKRVVDRLGRKASAHADCGPRHELP